MPSVSRSVAAVVDRTSGDLFLVITVSVVAANFVVDLMYGWLDPRVRR